MQTKLYTALSNHDISRALGGRVKVLTYDQLGQFKTLDELLEPFNRVVILYMSEKNFGHWTCVMKRMERGRPVVETFDSYGYKPDRQFEWITDYRDENLNRAKNGKKKVPYLQKLLSDFSKKHGAQIEYNHHKYQSEDPEIATCGRWCVLRLVLSDLPLDEFDRIVRTVCREFKISPDMLVCAL